jgi:hypothetical protein
MKSVDSLLKDLLDPSLRFAGKPETMPRSNQLTEEECMKINGQLAIVRNLSAQEIAGLLPSKPSKSTVLHVLCSNRYITYAKRKRIPAIKPHHKKARVAFAERYAGR